MSFDPSSGTFSACVFAGVAALEGAAEGAAEAGFEAKAPGIFCLAEASAMAGRDADAAISVVCGVWCFGGATAGSLVYMRVYIGRQAALWL